MITFRDIVFSKYFAKEQANMRGDCHMGNWLFFIAGTIGIAVKNGYSYGLPKWVHQDFFVNELPLREGDESNYQLVDIPWGFHGFDIPDNSSIFGYMQSEKYFEHCEDLIRHYFTIKAPIAPIKDTIFVHYRAYNKTLKYMFTFLDRDYYLTAINQFPQKRVIVLTDNIPVAQSVIGTGVEYMSNTPIEDFYLLCNADYVVMSNSSFSWWGAWLSKAQTVCPRKWFNPTWGDTPGVPNDTKDIYCKDWIKI